jgi:hypothetical protein
LHRAGLAVRDAPSEPLLGMARRDFNSKLTTRMAHDVSSNACDAQRISMALDHERPLAGGFLIRRLYLQRLRLNRRRTRL